jgi:hypothetical protein
MPYDSTEYQKLSKMIDVESKMDYAGIVCAVDNLIEG